MCTAIFVRTNDLHYYWASEPSHDTDVLRLSVRRTTFFWINRLTTKVKVACCTTRYAFLNPYIPTRGVKLPPRPHLPLYLRNHERWSYALLWLFLNMAGLQNSVFTGSTCVTKNPRWRLGNWKWVVDWHWSKFQHHVSSSTSPETWYQQLCAYFRGHGDQWHQCIIHTESMKTGNRYNCRQTGSSYISGNRRAR